MALDYGRRRIGVAASDPTRTIASPHSAVANRDPAVEPPETLVALIGRLEPALIVLGVPLNMDGSEGDMAAEARRFGRRLAALTGVRVVEVDERLTTVEAEERLLGLGLRRRKRREKGRADMLAAALLLEEYLAG